MQHLNVKNSNRFYHKPAKNLLLRHPVIFICQKTQQIQKVSFRCYTDDQVFGQGELANFLKQNHDNDHDTPQEQVKYDINRGIKKLKDQIDKRQKNKNGEIQNVQSQKAKSIGSTPPRYIKPRHR